MCQTPWFHPTDAFTGNGRGTCFVKHNPRFCPKEKKVHIYLLCTPLKNPSSPTKVPEAKRQGSRLFDSEPHSKKRNQPLSRQVQFSAEKGFFLQMSTPRCYIFTLKLSYLETRRIFRVVVNIWGFFSGLTESSYSKLAS